MGFNWVTFVAQIVNLFVLIWLLKHFLYKPVLDVIDKRQAQINAQVSAAQQAKEAADQEKAEWEKEKARFDDIRQKRLNDLATEEQNLRQQSSLDIKKAANEKRAQMQKTLDAEVASIQQEVQTIMAKQFLSLSTKIFTELAQFTPMDNVVLAVCDRIGKLTKKQKNDIQKTLIKQNVIVISSSNTLSQKQQKEIIKSLQTVAPISSKTKLVWKQDPELILGLEIHIGTTLLEWNLKNYLDDLQHNIHTETTSLILSEKDV